MNILSFGEIIWDVYENEKFIGGAPLNLAAHCSKQGAESFMLSSVGSDDLGFSALEISYSIGLSLGIIIFYNHLGKRKLTPDPTPVSVEMRNYEDDVNRSIVALANREEKTIDIN